MLCLLYPRRERKAVLCASLAPLKLSCLSSCHFPSNTTGQNVISLPNTYKYLTTEKKRSLRMRKLA